MITCNSVIICGECVTDEGWGVWPAFDATLNINGEGVSQSRMTGSVVSACLFVIEGLLDWPLSKMGIRDCWTIGVEQNRCALGKVGIVWIISCVELIGWRFVGKLICAPTILFLQIGCSTINRRLGLSCPHSYVANKQVGVGNVNLI